MILRRLAVLILALGAVPLLHASDYQAQSQDTTLEAVVHHWADHLGRRLIWEAPVIPIDQPEAFNTQLSLDAADSFPAAWDRLNYGLTNPRFGLHAVGATSGPQNALRATLFKDVLLVRPVFQKGTLPATSP